MKDDAINPNPSPMPAPSGPPVDPFPPPPQVPAVEAPKDDLPELPLPQVAVDWKTPFYTAEDMKAYGRKCRETRGA